MLVQDKSIISLVLLCRCDTCMNWYHFSCLDPPVKKSPKHRGYQWYCEDCERAEEEASGNLALQLEAAGVEEYSESFTMEIVQGGAGVSFDGAVTTL